MPFFQDFAEHPGRWYVIATLLPLASFAILILAGAVRNALRGTGGPLYRLLGGDRPGRTAAYVATAAIGLAFVCSVIGAANFVRHHGEEVADKGGSTARETAWAERTRPWAQIYPRGVTGTEQGTILELGYRIDSLSVVMFLMVTLIATLIHVYSMGYMADELQPVVEDHQVHTDQGHLHRRGRFGRFFLFLSLFCFSMLNLVLADNLFQVFVSWELVGICSYLLIGFFYERQSASNAANKAFITNRVGDAGFIVGLMILWTYVGTFNFDEIFQRVRSPVQDARERGVTRAAQIVRAEVVPGTETAATEQLRITEPRSGSQAVLFPVDAKDFQGLETGAVIEAWKNPNAHQFGSIPYWLLVAAGLGIFLGCVGKSAQFPLHVWLPDAMEGPTPVSALIHAATMVAAGVYLVGRCYPLFTFDARLVIAYTGGITLFVAATIALVMTDIKKVLAYSTVSQLGYMMLALGVGGWAAGLFHLITHAFFKALLFLCSGSVIYGCHHEQDMLKMGGLYPKMKITAWTMLIGVLTIAGIPFFSGWYSKDAILAQAIGFMKVHPQHCLLFILPLVTAGITTFYMFRMWFLTFAGQPRDPHVYEHAHESPPLMTVPLIILAFFSVTVAWGWPVWSAEDSLLERQIHHSQHHAVIAEFGYLKDLDEHWEGGLIEGIDQKERNYAAQYHHLAGSLATFLVVLAIIFAALIYHYRVLDPAEAKEQFPAVHRFLWNKWYFDELYSAILVRPALVVANWCRFFDTRVIDGLVDNTGRATVKVSRWDGRFDLGIIDGMVNLTADVVYAVGARLRRVQTGYLRSYVLFLVLAAIGLFALLALAIGGRAG